MKLGGSNGEFLLSSSSGLVIKFANSSPQNLFGLLGLLVQGHLRNTFQEGSNSTEGRGGRSKRTSIGRRLFGGKLDHF
jgi:hypothetical protein